MTAEELLKLDTEIAVGVMGLKPHEVRPLGRTETIRVYTSNAALLVHGVWSAAELERHGRPPKYSSDIGAAWQVFEKLKAEHGSNSVAVGWSHQTRQYYCADFDSMTFEGAGDTPQVAICRAALAAYGHAAIAKSA